MELVLEASVAHFAEAVEKDGAGERVARLAFVEAGVGSLTKVEATHPFERKEGPS